MTIFFGNAGFQNTAGDIAQSPGAAPVGSTMTGNPQAAQYAPFGDIQPAPQCGGAGQTVNTPLAHDGMSRGNVPVNAQPTNIGGGSGNDSIMAAMSRGQVLLNQSTYGQGGFMPSNGGSSPQAPQAGSAAVNSQANGIASTLTVASPAVYTGN
jgi:hypothetical protein